MIIPNAPNNEQGSSADICRMINALNAMIDATNALGDAYVDVNRECSMFTTFLFDTTRHWNAVRQMFDYTGVMNSANTHYLRNLVLSLEREIEANNT